MNGFVNTWMAGVNEIGRGFCNYAAGMLVQSGVLIVALLLVDLTLGKRPRATVRYWIWMLVFIKLLLPPTFALPTGIGYWVGGDVTRPALISPPVPHTEEAHAPVMISTPPEVAAPGEVPPAQMTAAEVPPVTMESAEYRAGRDERLTWQGGVFLLWGLGVLVFTGWVMQRLCFVRRLIAQAEGAQGPWLELLDQCRQRVGVRGQVAMKVSARSLSPAVCGLRHPTILMPASLLTELSPEKLGAVLIHELAHVKRADLWANCLQTALQIVYFYNPLVWLANAIVRRVREQAVDEMALVALGAEAESYGHTLIDIAEMTFLRASPALRLVGVAESKKSLEGRIKHMIARPIPKSAKVGVWGLSAIVIAAAALLPMARAQDRAKPATDANGPGGGYGILLLDDTDPQHNDKQQYDDRLYLTDSRGHVEGAVTGLNICQTIGGAHFLAVDERRRTLWVVENVGGRLWHFDLASGKLLQQIPVPGVRAVAVDPDTGNVWCAVFPEGVIDKADLQAISPAGRPVATYPIAGFDLAYSQPDRSLWMVGRDVSKVSLAGKVLGQITGQIPWCAVSVSVDQKTGNAWVVVGAHPQVVGSKDELWIMDRNVTIQKRIDLEELAPSCVAVDSEKGVVWVGCGSTTLRFATTGEKLKSARTVPSISVAPGASANSVIAANQGGLTLATIRDTGYVELGGQWSNLRGLLGSSQKWVAKVPWAGAKLPSSPALADLIESRDVSSGPGQKSATTAGGSREGMTSRAGGALSGVDNATDRKEYSHTRLAKLGKAVLLYANDHADQLPQGIEDVREHLNNVEVEWLLANAAYLGKDLSVADYPGRVVAYDKTLWAEGKGTNVLYLDSHVDFENLQELERLGIPSVRRDAALRTYEVNRSVPDFPRAEGFSTPEAAYATINRIDRSDPAAWQRVSVAALAERFAREGSQSKTSADPEWARILSDARILQVMVWNNARAAVMARLPQELSSQKIVAPIDVRYLERENGRWLNTGGGRFWTIEEAKAEFLARFPIPQQTTVEEQKVERVAAMEHLKELGIPPKP